jgi:hypothetical protein
MTVINIAAGAIYTKDFGAKDKIQLYGMALVFLLLLYKSPAGLVLYWTFNNIFSLIKICYYKIKFRRKNIAAHIFTSAMLSAFAIYVLLNYRGNSYFRTIIALIAGLAAFITWVWRFIKKHISGKIYVPLQQKTATLIFVLSCGCIWMLLGLVTPSLLVSASPAEFSYIDGYESPFFFLINTASQALGFFVFWPVCLYALFSEKTKKMLVLTFMAAAASALCNVFLFPGNYGLISVTLEFAKDVEHGAVEIIANIAVSLLFALAFMFLIIKYPKKTILPFFFVCFSAFIVLWSVNITRIYRSYTKISAYIQKENNSAVEVTPIFHLSKTGKNVVVIMLDRAISTLMPFVFDETPELNDKYSGFIYYPNTVSFNGYTRVGAPPIFGGYESTPAAINARPDVTLKQKLNEAILMMPMLFSRAGYSTTVTDMPYANHTEPPDMSIFDAIPNTKGYITDSVYTDIWQKEHNVNSPSVSDSLKRNILYYGLLRASPYFLRKGVYMNGTWCSPADNRHLILTINGYAVLDYLPRLTDFNSYTENTATLFVNNTTHEGSSLQAPDYRPVTFINNLGSSPFRRSPAYHVNAASIKRLSDWFDYLKENGVYDNTRIIIVSDHGPESNIVIKNDMPFNVEQFNPLLIVKDFDASGRLRTDNTFMSNADVPTLALRGLVDNPKNPYTGNSINMDAKQDPLYIAISASLFLDDPDETRIRLDPKKDYYVHDNIFDPNNWEKAEK